MIHSVPPAQEHDTIFKPKIFNIFFLNLVLELENKLNFLIVCYALKVGRLLFFLSNHLIINLNYLKTILFFITKILIMCPYFEFRKCTILFHSLPFVYKTFSMSLKKISWFIDLKSWVFDILLIMLTIRINTT